MYFYTKVHLSSIGCSKVVRHSLETRRTLSSSLKNQLCCVIISVPRDPIFLIGSLSLVLAGNV